MKITVSELRPKLTSVLKQVAAGESVDIVQRGEVVARLVPPSKEVTMWSKAPTPDETQTAVVMENRLLELHRLMTVEEAKRKDKARLDILRGVNRKS